MAAAPAHIVTAQLVADWALKLRNQLRSRLCCPADADDLAQEACAKFLQAQRANKPIRNPRAYLFRIAHHLLYHHYAGRQRRIQVALPDGDGLADDAAAVDVQAAEAFRREWINDAVAELPPKCREALYLRWREGYRVDEIAEAMGLSRGMVKKYLARGLAHCRQRLANSGERAHDGEKDGRP